ncbi:MAG TPA: AmmeMemoRadiSam system radical SAM enzyme [Candidatus Acidoferrum sp.]|nr:AmmeMemoRadiSam system radical SAM enzyme [Candidatus Acidoferrum sp.]
MSNLKVLQKTQALHEARWWERESDGRVHCYLCPRHCRIHSGQSGFCFIRINQDGKLYNLGYGAPAALQIDPIEKKPLNHFLPGTRVFSMGTAGCNMGCFFCQNWDISKSHHDQVRSQPVPPEEVPLLALRHGCDSIAFTYNEPTIWGEYVIDICRAAKLHGLKTVMVTNGYITYEAFHDIYDHVDAANVDLKAFTEGFYGKITLTHLEPVLKTLEWLKNETSVWFELTNLMIPTLNDDPAETRRLAEWVLTHLGPDVPLHFTAFHPDFKLQDKPPTPPETLHRARQIALDAGLHYVYEGNIYSSAANTYCPACGEVLIKRSWHAVQDNRIKNSSCPKCKNPIPGIWTVNPPHCSSPLQG